MKHHLSSAMATFLVLLALAPRIDAQVPRRSVSPRYGDYGYQRPTVSPYVNLLRGYRTQRNLPFEYYLRVRPARELEQAKNRARRRVDRSQHSNSRNRPAVLGTSSLRPTGHSTSFLNAGGYFNRANGIHRP